MKNLIKLYNMAPSNIKEEGHAWYTDTHNYCAELSARYAQSIEVVCAVFSALSPATNFEANKKDCLNLLAGTRNYRCTTYGSNVLKARNILSGKVRPENAFSLKTGPKTFSFYYNVLNPQDGTHTTIDRHAYRIATGNEVKSLSPNQYQRLANYYARAASKIGILPCQLQAVLWIDYRNKSKITFKKFADIEVPF